MARPVFWLALTDIVLAAVVVVLLLLLTVFNVFQQAPIPTLQDEINAANPSPWSPFLAVPNSLCKVYDVTSQGTPNPPGSTGPTGPAPRCVPLNSVGSIQTTRTCLRDGCIDLNGQAQPIGYVEKVYQDCTVSYNCQAGTTGCFTPVPSCEDNGYTLARIVPYVPGATTQCLYNLGSSTGNNLTNGPCFQTLRNQQFNLIPTAKTGLGQAYQIGSTLLSNPNLCVIPAANTTGATLAVLGACAGSFFLTPEAPVVIPVPSIIPGQILYFDAITPSQLVYTTSPDTFPTTIPSSYAALVDLSTKYKSLQGSNLAPFIPACYTPDNPPPLFYPGFPTIPPCATSDLIPTAVAL